MDRYGGPWATQQIRNLLMDLGDGAADQEPEVRGPAPAGRGHCRCLRAGAVHRATAAPPARPTPARARPPAACDADAARVFSSRGRSFSARIRTFSSRGSAASRSRLACSARGRASFSRTSASASESTPAGTATKHSRYCAKRITHQTRRVALRREIPGYLPFISSLRSPAQLPPGAEMVPVSWKLNVP
jgi:hypothetical protein